MRINCLACGHKVDLDDAYDDYEGSIKCLACKTILEIHAEQGKVKTVKLTPAARPASTEEAFEPAPKILRQAA